MKKLILSVVLAAFAVAVQAGDTQGSCCAKAAQQTKAECPMAKQAKGTCPKAAKKLAKQTVTKPLHSPKAVADAAR